MFTLHNGDCLEIMPTLPAGSVDAIITDLPYGTTACAWDTVIPFAPMWEQVKRVLKPSGAFITTASQPFTSALIMSNPKFFKDEWIWDKNTPTGFLNAKRSPLKQHESVCVFASGKYTYNPQMVLKNYKGYRSNKNHSQGSLPDGIYGDKLVKNGNRSDYRYPKTILFYQSLSGHNAGIHKTQKPVALYDSLIKTYTNEGETVLDIAMGSGTTIEAAERTGRNSIGIEKDEGIFQSAVLRLKSFTPSNNRMHLTAFGVESPASIPLQSNLFAEVPAAKLGGK